MISLSVTGLAKYVRTLLQLRRSIRSDIPLKRIGVKLTQKIDSYFNKQGNEGTRWAPLNNPRPTNKNILITTGALRSSFEFSIKRGEVIVGSKVEYSAKHQQYYGTTRFSNAQIPRRPMLPPQQIVGQIAEEQFNRYFNEVIGRV